MKRHLALLLALAMFAPAAASAKHHAAGSGSASSTASVTCAAGDPMVWVNTKSNVYHYKGTSYYGTTKHGHYACESAARSSGGHAAQGESPGGMSSGTIVGHRSHMPMTSTMPSGHTMVTHPTPAAHHFSFFHHTVKPTPAHH